MFDLITEGTWFDENQEIFDKGKIAFKKKPGVLIKFEEIM